MISIKFQVFGIFEFFVIIVVQGALACKICVHQDKMWSNLYGNKKLFL